MTNYGLTETRDLLDELIDAELRACDEEATTGEVQ